MPHNSCIVLVSRRATTQTFTYSHTHVLTHGVMMSGKMEEDDQTKALQAMEERVEEMEMR